VPPTIDLSLGDSEANSSPLLKAIVFRIGELKFVSLKDAFVGNLLLSALRHAE
jgi:hypothetical protein